MLYENRYYPKTGQHLSNNYDTNDLSCKIFGPSFVGSNNSNNEKNDDTDHDNDDHGESSTNYCCHHPKKD